MSRGSPSGHYPPRPPDDAVDDLPAEGTVMDSNLMAEYEASRQPGPGFASGRDESGLTVDPSDIVEEGDELADGPRTDQHELPESRDDYRTPVVPAPLPVTHRPTEQLP